jgi:hypothetical protein
MLGCRSDGFQPPETAQSEAEAFAYALQLCEEYRLQNGPRRPGDPCQTDFDCRPYAGTGQPTGTPWGNALYCVEGVCREDSGGEAAAGGGGAGGSNDSAASGAGGRGDAGGSAGGG